MPLTPTQEVQRAIINTPRDYLLKTLRQRSKNDELQLGSYYYMYPPKILGTLMLTDWELYAHPAVKMPAVAFKAPIPGQFGMVSIDEVERRIITSGHSSLVPRIVVVDPKGILSGQAAVQNLRDEHGDRVNSISVDFSVALVGPAQENRDDLVEGGVLWTVHPGNPVPPSVLPFELVGKTLPLHEARDLGVEWLKISQ